MPDTRLADVLRICQEALACEGTARAAYLDTACGADTSLRDEVHALLAAQASDDGFLDTPPWAAIAPALAAGRRLGPYEIRGPAGAGGMGEVYKAHDTRLGRTVAIKVIAGVRPMDSTVRERLNREARAVAALNHPHICSLYDVGCEGDLDYLVLEHLEGETLEHRVHGAHGAGKGKALKVAEATQYAIQIADALAAAHRAGIIHRDLKPANVMLTAAGAKLLDFGLAKWKAQAAGAVGDAGTGVAPASVSTPGLMVGTAAYMSPEQARGEPVDARSDLFSFGCVLYEMLSGERAFQGAKGADILAAIVRDDPPPLPADRIPLALARIVRQCLAKAPDDRPDTAHDIAAELRWAQETGGAESMPAAQPRRRHAFLALLVSGLPIAAIVGAGAMWALRPSSPPALSVVSFLDVRPAEELDAGSGLPLSSRQLRTPGGSQTALAWTPDGRALVFVGRQDGVQRLYVRPLDGEARPIPNSDGARTPALSPDGQWAAFWTDGTLRKVPLDGGPPMDLPLEASEHPWGMTWGDDGRIFYGDPATSIWQVSADGKRQRVSQLLEGELSHCLPWLLPGQHTILYTVRKRLYSWGGEEIVAQTLATGARQTLLREATDARYVASGHLVFLRRGRLFAVPFDPERVELTGSEVPVLETVAQALTGPSSDVTGAGQFTVSAGGDLAWVESPPVSYAVSSLVALDRTGGVSRLPAPPKPYIAAVRLSPDGRRLAVGIADLSERGLWVGDLGRPNLTLTRLSRGDEVMWPAWSPDGRRLAFLWLRGGKFSLAERPADGSGSPTVIVENRPWSPSSVLPNGDILAVKGTDGIVKVTREGRAQDVIDTPDLEKWPELSPDERWLAYGSNASGQMEIYVTSYPVAGAPHTVRVSVEGGECPAWHPNGRELFFLTLPTATGARQMMAVDFSPRAQPRVGRPHPLFEFDQTKIRFRSQPVRNYHVGSDGRFYAIEEQTPSPTPAVVRITSFRTGSRN